MNPAAFVLIGLALFGIAAAEAKNPDWPRWADNAFMFASGGAL